jgi:argininosuccinate lyase
MNEALQDDNLFATDLLDYLVRRGTVFAEAHETVGRVVRYALESGKPIRDLPLKEWKKFSSKFDPTVYDLFDPQVSVRAKRTIGSTHPARVRAEIAKWERALRNA